MTSVATMGVPANPNADLNLLFRRGRSPHREVQVPVNVSFRLGPGWDNDWFALQAGTGVFFKRSWRMGEPVVLEFPNMERAFFQRALWKAVVQGFTTGVYWGEWDPPSPYLGYYLKIIRERRRDNRVGLNGFMASVNFHPLVPIIGDGFYDSFNDTLGPGLEFFTGGFWGAEWKTHISQVMLGVGTDLYFMPRIVFGFSFGSKVNYPGQL